MTDHECIRIVEELRTCSGEREWFDFKSNHVAPKDLGEYASALANGACLHDRVHGYLVFGIENKTHDIKGTTFDPHTQKGEGNTPLPLWLSNGLNPNVGVNFFSFDHYGKHLVLMEIGAAVDRPVAFLGREWIRMGESKTLLKNHPELAREIWTKKHRLHDWTAQICSNATLDDLLPEAVQRARTEYKTKYPRKAADVDTWADDTFLNKARVTIQGQVTNAALVLLGRPESATLLAPAVTKMTWVLKDNRNTEIDYEHMGPPFLLSVDEVFSKIRNLTIRHLPDGTLFPLETTQYDPWVLREALNNCIAHQDYSLQGRINIVETPTDITFSNVGSFLPGSLEKVIQQDSPPEVYRNPFLAEAMVQLNMIDTQGGGIKRMFGVQVKRFFPLPDYDLSEPNRVSVKIRGEIIDERYTKLLISRTDIDLWDAILLDKVQKKQPISKEQCGKLRSIGAVEGRYPNVFVSARLAKATGHSVQHIRNRGLDQQYYSNLILELIREHGPVSRSEIDELLVDKLPEVLSEKQKKTRIHNLLGILVRAGAVRNIGSKRSSRWVIDSNEKK